MSWRPPNQFSCSRGFMNDPCGCIALPDGRYLMGFQHAPGWPEDPRVGWSLATSRDLKTWAEREWILPPDALGWAYSGSAMLDSEGVAGFGRDVILAFHTRHQPRRQRQHVAVSADMGATWRTLPDPIIDEGRSDSRDPFVFRRGDEYRLLLARPIRWTAPDEGRSRIAVYRSCDLLRWELLGDLGVEGGAGELFECPALLPGVAVEGGAHADVLLLSVMDRSDGGTRGRVDAYTGRFDGVAFLPDGPPQRLVARSAFYAAQPFSNLPAVQPLIVAWTGDWATARQTDFGSWSGGPMTLPRRMSVREEGAALRVALFPVTDSEERHPPSRP